MATKSVHLTPNGQRDLENELGHLRDVRRREVAARISEASESGGTVDNAEYEDAKNEQAFVEGRISELEVVLSCAVVAYKSNDSRGKVEFGSSVSVVSDGGKKQKYIVVGSAEADPLNGKISIESPVGQAIQGCSVGDEVEVRTPSGIIGLRITRVN